MKISLDNRTLGERARRQILDLVLVLFAITMIPALRAETISDDDVAVGYLMDCKGTVLVNRGSNSVPFHSSCFPLQKGDSVSLGDGGGATVLLPSRAYVIHAPGRYRIMETELRQIKGEGDSSVEPVLGSRGSSLLESGAEPLVTTPKMLFAAVNPPVMRAGARIEVLSPNGLTLSLTPDLVWTGNQTNEYAIQVIPLSDERMATNYPTMKITGCVVKWAQTGWPRLRRGEAFRVVISRRGDLLTDDSHTFCVVGDGLASRMQKNISMIENKLPSGVARDFTKASLLASPNIGFYAEARLMAVDLLKDDMRNPVYLKLMKRCYVGMGLAQGVMAVERRLSGEDAAAGDK